MKNPIVLKINPVLLLIELVVLIALICVGCAKKPEHDIAQDFASRVCDEKSVYAIVDATTNVDGVESPKFVFYYDDDGTITVYLIGYRDGEFIKETIYNN